MDSACIRCLGSEEPTEAEIPLTQKDLKIIVVNDNSYRVLLMRQRIQKLGRIHGTLHTNPEMTRLAVAFGAEALSVSEDSKIDEAVEFVLTKSDIPCIVELKISPEDLPPLNMETSLKF